MCPIISMTSNTVEMASTRPLWIFQPKYGRFIAKNVAKTMPFLPPMTGNGVYHKNGC